MPWNEPGGSGKKDPWGNRGDDQGPPDLDEVVRKFQQKLSGMFGGKGGGGEERTPSGGAPSNLVIIALILLVGWLAYDSTHIVDQAERGVVLRFGKYVDTLNPGLNIRLPRPIETVQRVNVEEVRTIAIGTTKAESLMLTQDENIIDIKFTVQYQVGNARDYLFNVRGPDITLRDLTESAVREVVGKSTMDFVITEGRDAVAASAKELMQTVLDNYGVGLQVITVNMQEATAPEEVQDAFADAVKSREDEVRFKNEAEAYARDVLGKAKGAEQRMIQEAEGYKGRVIESATGEARRFLDLLSEYRKAPDVTRERLYLEAMEEVLANSSKVMADVEGSGNLLLLPLDRMLPSRGEEPQQATSPAFSDRGTQAPEKSDIVRGRDFLRERGGR